MPWYWSDDLAAALSISAKLDAENIVSVGLAPVAFRRESDSIEEVALELAEDGEIPLAA